MMTTRDLLESASLDAFGLLDETERAEFESAFRAASPELQAMIRKEQVRFSDIDSWLPRVDEPAGLKHRVMSAWRSAVTAVREASEPIGQIGPDSAWTGNRRWTSAPMWRAACIGFATATIGLGWAVSGLYRDLNHISETVAQNKAIGELGAFGPQYREIFFSPNKRERSFVPAAGAPLAKAVLVYDSETRSAVLVCDKLPTNTGRYTLMLEAVDGGGGGSIKCSFDATGGWAAIPVELKLGADGSDPLKLLAHFTIHGPTANGADSVIFTAGNA